MTSVQLGVDKVTRFNTAPLITADDTSFRVKSAMPCLCIGWSGLPKTRNEISNTDTVTTTLAAAFRSVSRFICDQF